MSREPGQAPEPFDEEPDEDPASVLAPAGSSADVLDPEPGAELDAEPDPEPEPPRPDTRGRALVRLGISAFLSGLLLWIPVTRLAWSLDVASEGGFGPGVVVEEGEQANTRSDSAGKDHVVSYSPTVTVEYASPPRRTVFINRDEWVVGDAIDLAWLPADRPNAEGMGARVSRVGPGAGVVGIYFGIDGWPLDLLLLPFGLALALAVISNVLAVIRPTAPSAAGDE